MRDVGKGLFGSGSFIVSVRTGMRDWDRFDGLNGFEVWLGGFGCAR